MIAVLQPYHVAAACSEPDATAAENVKPGVPDADWTREDLANRADWEIAKLRRRKSYAPIYWWLGKVLLLVRPEFDQRGEWTAWREKHKIDRTKAQRAQFFARAFASPDELEGLSIKRAERLARERLGLPEPPTDEEDRIRRRVRQITRNTVPETLKDLAAMNDTQRVLP
ncbi:MAG: hypothetical protein ACREHD_34010 [Pirellulales bacterium]